MNTLSFQNTADFSPISLPATLPTGMRELSMEEIDCVSGGAVPIVIGIAIAVAVFWPTKAY